MKRANDASVKNFIRRFQPAGFCVYVAGLLSAAALVSAVRDGKLNILGLLSWARGPSSSQNLRLLPGLQNLGNNCFFNVILQVLLLSADGFSLFPSLDWKVWKFLRITFVSYRREWYLLIILMFFWMWTFLQALASCVFFQPFLQKFVEEFELHEGMSEALPLTVSLAALLEGIVNFFSHFIWRVFRQLGFYSCYAAQFDIFRSNSVSAARVSK